jgi:hypothetical protein
MNLYVIRHVARFYPLVPHSGSPLFRMYLFRSVDQFFRSHAILLGCMRAEREIIRGPRLDVGAYVRRELETELRFT